MPIGTRVPSGHWGPGSCQAISTRDVPTLTGTDPSDTLPSDQASSSDSSPDMVDDRRNGRYSKGGEWRIVVRNVHDGVSQIVKETRKDIG